MEPVTLTPQHIEDLKALETLHAHISNEIERARGAGLDMSEFDNHLNQLEATRQGLLKVYGGTRRRKVVG
jgi:hypothetical protein